MMEFSMDMFRLDGKVALVTGAVYGIGFEIARSLATAGAKIVFNNLNQESVDEGIAHYKEAGIDAKGYVCDVTDEEAVQAMVQQIKEDVGSVDILVNNAGIIKRTPMIEMDAADFRQVIDVDLNAPFIVSKAVIPDMIEKGGGKIINICSMMSELGRETVSAYAAAKGGLKMLTKNIASEYGQYNINVMELDQVILLHRKLLHYAKHKKTVNVIHSINLSLDVRQQHAGASQSIWLDHLSSWLLAHLISLTAMSCMWTEAYLPISENNLKRALVHCLVERL